MNLQYSQIKKQAQATIKPKQLVTSWLGICRGQNRAKHDSLSLAHVGRHEFCVLYRFYTLDKL